MPGNVNKVGILHPGSMGARLAACLIENGCEVYWLPEGRSKNSQKNANAAGIVPLGSMNQLLQICDIIVSVCPPSSALNVFKEVLNSDFRGVYCEANAISPETVKNMAFLSAEQKIEFIDACVIGLLQNSESITRMYFSGKGAEKISSLFQDQQQTVFVIDDEVGSASALKMCHSAWSKGRAALLLSILELSKKNNVYQALSEEWEISQVGVFEKANKYRDIASTRAWRWHHEMMEIANTFDNAKLPTDFMTGASKFYKELSED